MMNRLTFLIVMIATVLTACASAGTAKEDSTEAVAESYTGRKIAFVNSYHEGYE
jgi:hypothetical protein